MTRNTQVNTDTRYDVAAIGAGPAGLSAARVLGRARRSVPVIDDARPRNASAAHPHGFLSRDGAAPGDVRKAGPHDVAAWRDTGTSPPTDSTPMPPPPSGPDDRPHRGIPTSRSRRPEAVPPHGDLKPCPRTPT
ncbi:hypothetical protein ACWF94_07365 [Streptomyces sp. NPDC055078]